MENQSTPFSLGTLHKRVAFKYVAWFMIALKLIMVSYFLFLIIYGIKEGSLVFDSTFLLFILVGFLAEVVDGALGMAYGVSCTTLLLNFGIPAKMASASVHTSEIFTTGVSGLSHIKFNNIDKKLFFQIVITGSIGACLGAYLISDFFDGDIIKPYISGYLLIMGFYIIYKAFNQKKLNDSDIKRAPILAFFGGLLDALGGGGWGPIVTTNLLSQGKDPRLTIGTVNTAEFFVTYFATAIFIFILGVQHLQIVLGLIIGGVIAAPLGAFIAARINKKLLLILVGLLIIATTSYTLLHIFFKK